MKLRTSQALDRGLSLMRSGRLEEAKKIYQTILKLDLNHSEANHKMGLLAIESGSFRESISFLKRAIKAKPQESRYWKEHLKSSIKIQDEDKTALTLEALKQMGIDSKVLSEFKEEIQRKDSVMANSLGDQRSFDSNHLSQLSIDEVINLAKKEKKNSSFNKAKDLCQHVLQSNPHNRKAKKLLEELKGQKVSKSSSSKAAHYFNLGNSYRRSGNLNYAIMNYERAIMYRNKHLGAHINLGVVLISKGDLQAAEAAFKNVIIIDPKSYIGYGNYGLVLLKTGKMQAAIAKLEAALKINPKYFDAQYNLGKCYWEQAELDLAWDNYEKAIKLSPDSSPLLNDMGVLLLKKKKFQLAKEFIERSIMIDSNCAYAHNNLGLAHFKLHNINSAIENFKQALKLDTQNFDAHIGLGNCFKKVDKMDLAVKCYESAIIINPGDASSYFNLANLYKDLSYFEKAIKNYRAVLNIHPDHDAASHLLSSLLGKTTNSPPRSYVENVFDEYASTFEESLVDKLGYKVPKLIAKLISDSRPSAQYNSALDMGCGTGLVGQEIKKIYNVIDGIDLSRSMLQEASKKNVYRKLIHIDILEFLYSAELKYDCFIAADVFIYMGDVKELFKLIKLRHDSGGSLIFSTELAGKSDFRLEKSGRYSHSDNYIRKLAKKYDYKFKNFEEFILRKEFNTNIVGGLYSLEF